MYENENNVSSTAYTQQNAFSTYAQSLSNWSKCNLNSSVSNSFSQTKGWLLSHLSTLFCIRSKFFLLCFLWLFDGLLGMSIKWSFSSSWLEKALISLVEIVLASWHWQEMLSLVSFDFSTWKRIDKNKVLEIYMSNKQPPGNVIDFCKL